MFIYCIRNTSNNKVYIGQTVDKNPLNRWWQHKTCLRKNRCNNIHFQRAWNKYGEQNWEFFVIDKLNGKKQTSLDLLETYYIDLCKSRSKEFGYNMRAGGSRGKHLEESKRRISRALTGKKLSASHRKSLSLSHIGIIQSKETRHKRSVTMMGHKISTITRKKISQACNLDRRLRYSKQLRKMKLWPKVIFGGKLYTIVTLRGFCRQHNIPSFTNFRRMLEGKYQSMYGWKLA